MRLSLILPPVQPEVYPAADPFKTAADASGVTHQVCKSHVLRNTATWVAAITPALVTDADGSLALIGVVPTQAVADCQDLLRLMMERQPTPDAGAALARIHRRYLGATKPSPGGTMSLAYRLAPVQPGPLEPLAALDPLSPLARPGRRDAGWDHQRL